MLRSALSNALVLALCGVSADAFASIPEVEHCKEDPPGLEALQVPRGGENLLFSPGTSDQTHDIPLGPRLQTATTILHGNVPPGRGETGSCDILRPHPIDPDTGLYTPRYFEWRVTDPAVEFETAVGVWSDYLPELPSIVDRIDIAEWTLVAEAQGQVRSYLRIGLEGAPGGTVNTMTAEFRDGSGNIEQRSWALRSGNPSEAHDTSAMVAWIPPRTLKVAVGGVTMMTINTRGDFPMLVRKGLIEAQVSDSEFLATHGEPTTINLEVVHQLVDFSQP